MLWERVLGYFQGFRFSSIFFFFGWWSSNLVHILITYVSSLLIALGEKVSRNFQCGHFFFFWMVCLLIVSKFWWVSWKNSCSFWDKISQTLSNNFYALAKLSKLWSNFMLLCGKALKTIIKFHNAFVEKLSN